jgi:hypothetical protein
MSKEKKVVSRSVATIFGIICITLVAGLVGAFAYYVPMTNDKSNTISSLNSQISQLDFNVTNLQNRSNQLQGYLDDNKTLLNQTQTWLNGNVTYCASQISALQNVENHLKTWLNGNITYYTAQIKSLNSEIDTLNNTIFQLTSFAKIGQYMTYEQFFEWTGHNETTFMTWNITGLEAGLADLHLISYDLNVNASDNSAIMNAVDENWTVYLSNREIVNSTDSSIIGLKCPFWIEKNVEIGSVIDTLYGQSTITRSDIINVLGQQRDCWVVEYDWPTSSMVRWYDKSTGIVLMIRVFRQQQNITIQSTETATQTNIVLLQ